MNTEHILVFRSNIKTASDRFAVERVLDSHPHIDQWTVDCDDTDCVLRVVSSKLTHKQVIAMVTKCGYNCEELID
jgi:hypothetical protein